VELVRQAAEEDVTVSSVLHTNNETAKRKRHESSDQEAWKTLLYIRVFLQRMWQLGYLNMSDHDV